MNRNDTDIWREAGAGIQAAPRSPTCSQPQPRRQINNRRGRQTGDFSLLVGRCWWGERWAGVRCAGTTGTSVARHQGLGPCSAALMFVGFSLSPCLCVSLSSVSLHLFISPFLVASASPISLCGSLSLFILFIYFWLCWVFVSVRGLSLIAASGGPSSSRCAGLSLSRPLLLRGTGSRRAGSVIVAHGPSCSAACGIFPD